MEKIILQENIFDILSHFLGRFFILQENGNSFIHIKDLVKIVKSMKYSGISTPISVKDLVQNREFHQRFDQKS